MSPYWAELSERAMMVALMVLAIYGISGLVRDRYEGRKHGRSR